MTLNIHRTLPPAAAPFPGYTFVSALRAMVRGKEAIDAFQRSIGDHYGRRHCIPISSGAAALTLILGALKKNNPKRRRVVVPGYTCYSVPAAIKRAGLEIHPIDIDPATLDFDSGELSETFNRHVDEILAVIPTHLFGVPSNVQQLRSMLNEEEIVIIEDAAQALGAFGPQGRLGGIGDVGFFSLGRGKAFSTMGGGVIVTDDSRLARQVRKAISQFEPSDPLHMAQLILVTLFVHIFSRPALFWLPKALPFLRLGETIYDPDFGIETFTAFQAGLGSGWQERLQALRIQRESNAEQWQKLTRTLGIETPSIEQEHLSNLIRYPIYISQPLKQKELLLKSQKLGLGIMPGYPDAITRISALKDELSGYNCGNAQQVARQLITLPTHGWVTTGDRHRIAKILASTLDRQDAL